MLQAVSVVDENIVWVSGHRATYARTVDGGTTWEAGVVPGPDSLQFRDVHAVDAKTAYLLSAGPGDMSRIYKTTDAGQNWTLQFSNTNPRAFFDCMDFWDAESGMAFSDGQVLNGFTGMGLVGDVFSPSRLRQMSEFVNTAIGHVRYSTSGSSRLCNAQPLLVEYAQGQVAVAHNGNLINAARLRKEYEAFGHIFQGSSDTEIIAGNL